MVLILLRIDGRNLALPKGIVKRVVNCLRKHPKAASLVAVDNHVGGEAACLLIARDVVKQPRRTQFFEQPQCPLGQLHWVRVDHNILVLRPTGAHPNLNFGCGLKVDREALHIGHSGTEPPCDFGGRVGPLVASFEHDGHAPGVRCRINKSDAHERINAADIRIAAGDLGGPGL